MFSVNGECVMERYEMGWWCEVERCVVGGV